MSSDHLSFNQSGDDRDDDGSRWEAYLALLRRTGAEPSAPESQDDFADASDSFPPAALAVSAVSDVESGATNRPRSTPSGAATSRLGSGLAGAAIGLVAGFILAASLISHPSVRRDAPGPTRTPAVAHVQAGLTSLAAESGPASLSGGNSPSAGSVPATLVSAPSPHHHPKPRHLARRAHECWHCRGNLRRSDTIAVAARYQTPWSR